MGQIAKDQSDGEVVGKACKGFSGGLSKEEGWAMKR